MLRTSPRTNNNKTSSPRSRAWWSKRPSEDTTVNAEPRRAVNKSPRSQRRNSLSPRYSPVNDPRVVSFLESNALVTGPDGVVIRPPRPNASKPLEIESSRWKQVHSPPTQQVQGLGLTSDSSKESRPNLKKSLTMLVKMPSFTSKNNSTPKSPHQKSKSEDLRPTWETEDYRQRPYDLRPYDAKPQPEEPKPLPLSRKMSDLDELAQRYQNMMEVRGQSKALPSLPTPPRTPPTESEEPLLLLPQTYSGSPSTSSSSSDSEPEYEPVLRKSRAQRFGANLESEALKQIDEQGMHPLQSHPWNYLYQDAQAAEISSDRSSSTASDCSGSPKTFSIGSLSPQSDVTLVAFPQEDNMTFKEDAIYFKPVSFGPTPPATPPQDYRPNGKFDIEQPVGLGMLAQDMVCSLADASPRADNKFDRMQVTVMIETYERLRDNMVTMGVSQEEVGNAKAVFDCWLSALNSIRCAMGDDNECAWI